MRPFAIAFCVRITCFLLLFICSCAPVEQDRAEIFRAINTEVKVHSKAYSTLKVATEKIGHRLTGSENGRKAEQHVYDLLKSYGIDDVQYHEFEAISWSRDKVSLEIKGEHDDKNKIAANPGNSKYRSIQAVTLAHSPVSAEVEGPLVDIGNGLAKDFALAGDELKGKIALINIGIYPKDTTLKNLHRSEKTALAIEHGAKGIVFINTVAGEILLTGTASVTGELISIPAVCISLESGNDIRNAVAEGWMPSVRIAMTNRSEKIKARNVVATIRGSELPREEVLIGGHLDSWDLSTGAIDNGIGSFSIIEMARVFQKLGLQPKRTVKFILFMGEEQGLLGSKAYLRDRIKDGTADAIRYMINIDMGGNTIGFNAAGRPEMEIFIKDVGAEIAAIDTVFRNKYSNRVSLHSDHQTFMLEGIPVMGIESNLDPSVYRFYHSNKDDFNLVNKSHMDNCVRFTAMMLYALADADAIASKRLTSEETKEFFIKANLREELVLGKEWRWGE